MNRDTNEKREEGKRGERNLNEKPEEKREEGVLTCVRGSPIVKLRILPIQSFESWSRTTPARILQSFAIHEACHAQPLSRSLYISLFTYKYTCTRTQKHVRSMMCTVRSLPPSTMVSFFCFRSDRKMSITRSGRQQRMCKVWYMIRKGNGRQPDNICCLIPIILSKNKACDCYCHQILIDLSNFFLKKKHCNCDCYLIRNCRLKNTIVL